MDGDFIKESIEIKERFDLRSGARSAFRALNTSISLIQKPAVILPSLAYLLIQLAVMYLYLGSHGRPWTSFWAIFSGSIDADHLGHFPQHLIFMQPILGRATIFLDTFVNIAFQAATATLVAMAYRKKKVSLLKGFTIPFSRYPHLVMVSMISSTAIYAVINLTRLLSMRVPDLLRLPAMGAGVILALLIQVLFLYAIPLIVLDRPKISEIFPAAFGMTWKHLVSSIFIVILPFILTIPTTFLSLKAELIAMQLSPDFMIHSHVASLVMESIAAFLITAGATIFIIHKTREGKER